MKILALVDKPKSAISILTQSIVKHNPHLDIEILSLHPKRPSLDEIESVTKAFNQCDLLHVAYWKSAEKLKEFVDISKKPKVLCHYNPYDATNPVNHEYDRVVVGNAEIQSRVPYAKLIPYDIDLDFYKFNPEYTKDNVVNMVVGRIESKKGVKEVAQACAELGYRFVLVGRISDPEYFKEILSVNKDVEFHEDVTDEEKLELYKLSSIHVCNSVDDFESGTLPILEAMAVGVPVLTRPIGHVPDLYDGANMVIRGGKKEDVEDLKECLKEMTENIAVREKIRSKAWNTIKNRDEGRMAKAFEYVWDSVVRGENDLPLVSVIIPTKGDVKRLDACVKAILAQTYEFIEIVIVENSPEPVLTEWVANYRKNAVGLRTPPIKYIYTPNHGEHLIAKARNLGIIEAIGGLLVFCDDRISMSETAISNFVKNWQPRAWLWGIKDGALKGFVENFSCVGRQDLIKNGMFNERIDSYGGMTQEISMRLQDRFQFQLVNDAQARENAKSGNKSGKRSDIIKSKLKLFKLYGNKEA